MSSPASQDRVSIDDPALARQLLLVPAIVWAALLFSVLFYGVVGYLVLESRGGPPGAAPPRVVIYALLGAALAVSATVPALRRRLLPPAAARGAREIDRRRVGRVAARYFTATIVSAAMAEAISIFGLVLTLMSGAMGYVLALSALAVVHLLAYRPSAARLRAMLRAAAAAGR